jgi:hypothetical protein
LLEQGTVDVHGIPNSDPEIPIQIALQTKIADRSFAQRQLNLSYLAKDAALSNIRILYGKSRLARIDKMRENFKPKTLKQGARELDRFAA